MQNDGFSIGTGEGMVCGEGGATDALSRQVRKCPIVLETECNFLRQQLEEQYCVFLSSVLLLARMT